MAFVDIFKVSRKTFLDPAGWLGAREIETNSRAIWGVLRGLFARPVPETEETFEEAMERLELTEAEVQSTAQTYLRTAYLFLCFAVCVFLYSFYLLFSRHLFFGFCLGLAATSLFLAQAFKYHFWSFQMKSRKLGATFAEWKQSVLGH